MSEPDFSQVLTLAHPPAFLPHSPVSSLLAYLSLALILTRLSHPHSYPHSHPNLLSCLYSPISSQLSSQLTYLILTLVHTVGKTFPTLTCCLIPTHSLIPAHLYHPSSPISSPLSSPPAVPAHLSHPCLPTSSLFSSSPTVLS